MPIPIPNLQLGGGPKVKDQDFNTTIVGPNFGTQNVSPTVKPGGVATGSGEETSQLFIVGGILIVGVVVIAILGRRRKK